MWFSLSHWGMFAGYWIRCSNEPYDRPGTYRAEWLPYGGEYY